MNSESNASPLDLTVAICTWNRAALLRQTLQSMQKLIIPEGVAWEVLVVNNNCTDNTSDVIQEFARQLPIRECLEPTPGKSHALNTGTQAARGRMIIWTDDDVLVRPDWLAAYWDAINRYPQAEFFGGPVEPWFETDPPQWLEKAWPVVRHAYASINHSDHDMPITEKSVPFGVNWAIRKATQLAYGYDPRLGPRPNSTLRGEETTLVRQMLAAGVPGQWVANAKMQHFVPQDRMTLSYLQGFYFGLGQYSARVRKLGIKDHPQPSLWRLRATIVRCYLLYAVTCKITTPDRWIKHFITSHSAHGALCEYLSTSCD